MAPATSSSQLATARQVAQPWPIVLVIHTSVHAEQSRVQPAMSPAPPGCSTPQYRQLHKHSCNQTQLGGRTDRTVCWPIAQVASTVQVVHSSTPDMPADLVDRCKQLSGKQRNLGLGKGLQVDQTSSSAWQSMACCYTLVTCHGLTLSLQLLVLPCR